MGDYLRYLHEETASYIKICHSDGSNLWDEVKDKAIFVLGHPNGWKGVPQQRYRTSAVLGGLIQDTAEGHARVKFVTEGEASALACLSGGLGPPSLDVCVYYSVSVNIAHSFFCCFSRGSNLSLLMQAEEL